MDQKAKEIKIAEACGYSWMTKIGSYTTHHFAPYKPEDVQDLKARGFVEGRHGEPRQGNIYGLDQVPAYFENLDGCHQMEKILPPYTKGAPQFYEGSELMYRNTLHRMCGNDYYRATPAQRAEAFGITRGLWPAT